MTTPTLTTTPERLWESDYHPLGVIPADVSGVFFHEPREGEWDIVVIISGFPHLSTSPKLWPRLNKKSVIPVAVGLAERFGLNVYECKYDGRRAKAYYWIERSKW